LLLSIIDETTSLICMTIGPVSFRHRHTVVPWRGVRVAQTPASAHHRTAL